MGNKTQRIHPKPQEEQTTEILSNQGDYSLNFSQKFGDFNDHETVIIPKDELFLGIIHNRTLANQKLRLIGSKNSKQHHYYIYSPISMRFTKDTKALQKSPLVSNFTISKVQTKIKFSALLNQNPTSNPINTYQELKRGLALVIKLLKQVKSSPQIVLMMNEIKIIHPFLFLQFFKQLKELKQFHTFVLDVSKTGLAEMCLTRLWKSVQAFPHLKGFHIKVNGLSSISTQTLNKTLIKASNIKNFSLSYTLQQYQNLQQAQIDGDNKQILESVLNHQKHLETLSLNYSKPTDMELELISKHIQSYQGQLCALALTLCEYTENLSMKGVQQITNCLKNQNQLKILKIHFKKSSEQNFVQLFDDKFMTELAIALTPLYNLTNLSLKFYRFKKLTNNALINLASIVKGLKSLTQLTLHFPESGDFDEIGFNELFQAFFFVPRLIHLSLDFSEQQNLKDKDLKDLSIGLRKMKKLQKFELNLNSCNQFNGTSLFLLLGALKSLPLFKKLNFSFNNCQEIKEEIYNELKKQVDSSINYTLPDESIVEVF